MDVQQFERLLMRYERLAYYARRFKELEKRHTEVLGTLMAAQAGNSRRDRDMRAAEAKIEEWRAYAGACMTKVASRRWKELPDPPKPLETEIPF